MILETLFEGGVWYSAHNQNMEVKGVLNSRRLVICHSEKSYQAEIERLQFCSVFIWLIE